MSTLFSQRLVLVLVLICETVLIVMGFEKSFDAETSLGSMLLSLGFGVM